MSGKYWTASWNCILGCEKCSPGCRNCWALSMVRRGITQITPYGDACLKALGGNYTWAGETALIEDAINKPLHWREPRTIAPNWLGDMWRRDVPDGWVESVIDVAQQAPQHHYLFLTKQIQDMERHLSILPRSTDAWPDNHWHGLTICNQAEADAKIPHLYRILGKRWLSIEPLLERLCLDEWLYDTEVHAVPTDDPDDGFVPYEHHIGVQLHWVVVGAETGPGARECKPEWVQSIVDQCAAAGVPCWVKKAPGGLDPGEVTRPWPREKPAGMP